MKIFYLFAVLNFLLSCNNSKPPSDEEMKKIEQVLHVPETIIFDETDLAGIWTVTMKIKETTCDNKPGDIKTERWIIEKLNGEIVVRVKDNDGTNNEYKGSFENNILKLNGKAFDLFSEGDVNVKAQMVNKNTIDGTREIIINKPCKIFYNITATKN